MKSRIWMSMTVVYLFAALAITIQTSAQSQRITFDAPKEGQFTTFDPTGSIFTVTAGINPAGAITGYIMTQAW